MGMYEQHYLRHWGIKGMKWGVRRYQNEDGTLTAAGKKRYNAPDEGGMSYKVKAPTGARVDGQSKTKMPGGARSDGFTKPDTTRLTSLGYQNKDGTLSERGKKRMYRDMFDQEGKDMKEQKKYTADPTKWVGEDMRNTKEGLDASRQLTQELKKVTDTSISRSQKNKQTMDLSNMSDKEMRDAINRAILERQYNDMFAPQASTKGRETVSKVLETAGSVLAIGSSALGIALAVGKLTGKVS